MSINTGEDMGLQRRYLIAYTLFKFIHNNKITV